MPNKIADFLLSRKGADLALIVIVLLTGATSFGLGRLSKDTSRHTPVTLYIPQAAEQSAGAIMPVLGVNTEDARSVPTQTPAPTVAGGGYVASKNGSVYHLPWCSGAKRIKEENKVWYATKADAEAAGLRPASNCKGI